MTQGFWPELPVSGFIAGRSASQDDVADGNAIFSLEPQSLGPPDINVPQYALWRDEDGREFPVFVIQAEHATDDLVIVGLRHFDGRNMVATLPEITLLGTRMPE